MQLVAAGPNVPEELFRAQETGELVFFCGSGISRPAGLPDFTGLVSHVYEAIGESLPVSKPGEPDEPDDRKLFLLEQRLEDPGVVRKAVRRILLQSKRSPESKRVHRALLDLGRGPDKKLHLVTTNFDRLFQNEARSSGYAHEKYAGPHLPLLRHNDWDGLVYLHGLLDAKDETPPRIVLTSGDFGAAYLVDRWASRFLADLFSKFTVCFVGYSLTDPVVRYMTDALSAAKLNGEPGRTHYAFSRPKDIESWNAKGIVPVEYGVFERNGTECHSRLYTTLEKWAALWREGTLGRCGIVEECAHRDPKTNSDNDDFVGRMVWALSDPTGKAAKTFAESRTEYPEAWLNELVKPRTLAGEWLGVPTPEPERGREVSKFSLFEHPQWSKESAPGLVSFHSENGTLPWDPIVRNLSDWFFRHLNNERFFIWAATRPSPPSEEFRTSLQKTLQEARDVELAGEERRNEFLATYPQGIPDETLRWAWRLILHGQTGEKDRFDKLFLLLDSIEKDGWSEFSVGLFQSIIEPVFVFSDSKRSGRSHGRDGRRFSFACEVELSFPASIWACYWSAWLDKSGSQLDSLFEVVECALLKALDFLRQLEIFGQSKSSTEEQLVSVSKPDTSCGDWKWTFLVEMLRDLWMKKAAANPNEARKIAERWIDSPHSVFRRLALFAASETDLVPSSKWIRWLFRENKEILWKDVYKREVCQLLKKKAGTLSQRNVQRIEKTLLAGLPQDGPFPQWRINEARWVRLVKLQEGSGKLSGLGERAIVQAVKFDPSLRTDKEQSEEFPLSHRIWVLDKEEDRKLVTPPDRLDELVKWLRDNPSNHRFNPTDCKYCIDSWSELAAKKPDLALAALRRLESEGTWSPDRWGEAIDSWKESSPVAAITRDCVDALRAMPSERLSILASSLAYWAKKTATTIDRCDDLFFELCNLILRLGEKPKEEGRVEREDPFSEVLQHPAKDIAEALLEYWVPPKNRTVVVSLGNLSAIQTLFEDACNRKSHLSLTTQQAIRAGLMEKADRLFSFKRDWTSINLLPWLDWKVHPEDALVCWHFFLYGNSFNIELLQAIAPAFLDTAEHIDGLGGAAHNYYMLLSGVAYQRREGFPTKRLRTCIGKFPQEGIDYLLRRLAATAKAAGEKGAAFWKENGWPFFRDYLPKDKKWHSEEYIRSMALTIIYSGPEFGKAFHDLDYVFHRLVRWYEIPKALLETEQCKRFPKESLSLLSKLIQDPQFMYADDLEKCVNEIKQANKRLSSRCAPLERIIEQCPHRH